MKNLAKPVVSFVLGGVVSAGILTAVLATGSSGPATAQVAAAHHERHPFLFHAMHSLTFARKQLMKGSHDFHGHRVAALKHTDEAIAQLRLAIRGDKH